MYDLAIKCILALTFISTVGITWIIKHHKNDAKKRHYAKVVCKSWVSCLQEKWANLFPGMELETEIWTPDEEMLDLAEPHSKLSVAMNPEKPAAPENPMNPEKPATPENPMNKEKPATPENPMNQENIVNSAAITRKISRPRMNPPKCST